jgi:hypothetical protein
MPESVIEQALDHVADRTPIDWDALERSLGSADDRRWLECVRVLEDIANFHCSSREDDPPGPRHPPDADADATATSGGSEATTIAEPWWGRYRLDQKVGEGAFGCVYRAWDPELEREVAVKVLHKRVAEARLRQALLHEGRALARVRHAHVVSVLGVESHEDQIALCMEFVHGETLEDVLNRGPLSAGEATLACQDVCRALAAVHLAGFVHQDVKARNVMREKAGRIVLMDFGAGQDISKLAAAGRRVAGTPLYMAPEVLAGEPASIVSDVYSVGVLLYHLVTGYYPVEAATLEGICAAHMQGRRRLLSERRPDLPVAFLQVVDKALASDPKRRYASAAQLLEALISVADDVKKAGPAPTPALLVRAVTGVGALLLTAAAVGFILSVEFNHALGRTEFVRETPLTWLVWGLRSWLGTVITLLVYGLGASALLVVRQLAVRMSPAARALEGRVVTQVRAIALRAGANDPTVGICVAVLAAGLSLLGAFWYFEPLLATLLSNLATAPREALELLSPDKLPYHELYRKAFTGIMIFAGLVFYASWQLARRRRAALHTAIASGAGAVFLLALIYLSLPFRVIYINEFDVVSWQGKPCYAIGERQDDLLLFCPTLQPSRNRVVKKGSPGLEYAGRVENIFTPFQPAAPPSGEPGR